MIPCYFLLISLLLPIVISIETGTFPETGFSGVNYFEGNTIARTQEVDNLVAHPRDSASADSKHEHINWFSQPPAYVHGAGISRLSSYYPERSYENALEKAIEDLNSNTRVLITVETFAYGAGPPRTFSEVAIDDVYSEKEVLRVDSLVSNGHVFYLVSDSLGSRNPIPDRQALSEDFITSNNATRVGEFWYAAGQAELSQISVYRSWVRAKKAALINMGAGLTTLVQSLHKTDGIFDAGSIRYTRSQVMLNNVHIVKRIKDTGQVMCIIAVHEDDIFRLSNI